MGIKRMSLCGLALVGLAACQPAIPDSGAGVGFDNYDEYQQRQSARDAALQGGGTSIPGPSPVQQTPLDTPATEDAVAAAERALNSGETPLSANPNNPAPTVVNNPTGISGENDFGAVSGQRSIADDAALIAQNSAQYQVVQPTALPQRENAGPNIVDYALETTHPVGEKIWSRSVFSSEAKYVRACRSFDTNDLAQVAFLEKGGPRRDRLGVDPDGDGYACNWDPAPFRVVKNN